MRNEEDAKAAVRALAPPGSEILFRDLSAFHQQPGEASVCGEVAFAPPYGKMVAFQAFFAARTKDGWRARLNPTVTTLAAEKKCADERGRLLRFPGQAARRDAIRAAAPDLERRCPMDAGLFWTDFKMTCAGFALGGTP